MSDITRHVETLSPEAGVLVGGTWHAGDGGTFEVLDPATERTLAHVGDASVEQAAAALDAAVAAGPAWAATAPRVRSEALYRAFEMMRTQHEVLAQLISAENGKSLTDARGEVTYAAEFFRWFAEEAVRTSGDYGPSPAGGTRTVVTRKAVGVAALVTPWNFPAAMATRKIAPALAAGCTVVLKPAAETPLTALAIGRILTEAGVPNGVVNVVPSSDAAGIVTTWMEDPRVRKISFTGSTRVGQILLRQAADRVVNASMELGGNAPFVVTADADVEAAVAGAMIAKFRGGGQACTAANRLFVHADVVEAFTQRLGVAVEALTVGPASEGSQVGPLISAKAVSDVTALVETAVGAGARVVHQAPAPTGPGYFVAPTVLRDVPADADIVRQEIFGPIAPIVTWTDEDQMLREVNDSEFGLAAYVFAGGLQQALRIGEAIDAGMVGVNRGLVSDPAAPFGGMKQSGLGREGARAGLEEFTETKYLSIDWPT